MTTEILIIDDNADIRLILNELIKDSGYKTRLAANYNQALTEIDKKLPDVAIIDVKLDKGENDGIELLIHLKKINDDIPVIMISGHANVQMAVDSLKLGAFEFIQKPFSSERLLKKGGRTIPQSGKIKIALIDNSPEISNSTSVASVQGFDLSLFNSLSQKKFNSKLRDKPVLLSDPKDAFNINLCDTEGAVGQEKIIELRVNQDGLCVGLIQWIWIHLYEEIEYENKPGECDSHWNTPIYLFDKPVVAKKGDVIEIKAVLGEDHVWFCQLA